MIYSRFGTPVKLLRPVTTAAEVKRLENRKPDAHDAERMKYGMYVAGSFDDDATERLFDLGLLRADDGIAEINKAARAVGCDPK